MVYCPVWWRYKNMIYAQRIIRLDTDQRDSSINTGSWLQCPHHPRYCKYWDIGLLISPAIPSILIVSPAVALFPTADVKWLSCDLQTCRPYHLSHYGGIFRLSMVQTGWTNYSKFIDDLESFEVFVYLFHFPARRSTLPKQQLPSFYHPAFFVSHKFPQKHHTNICKVKKLWLVQFWDDIYLDAEMEPTWGSNLFVIVWSLWGLWGLGVISDVNSEGSDTNLGVSSHTRPPDHRSHWEHQKYWLPT